MTNIDSRLPLPSHADALRRHEPDLLTEHDVVSKTAASLPENPQ